MKPTFKSIDSEEYAKKYSIDMNFEAEIIANRHENTKRFLLSKKPSSVLEIGCGPDLLVDALSPEFSFIKDWHVVEPAVSYVENAINRQSPRTRFGGNFSCSIGYVEEICSAVHSKYPDGFNAVLLSGVLHETNAPKEMLQAAKSLLKVGGWAYILVPNANSFHRLLALKMGLIKEPSEITERNVVLGQSTVYDLNKLRAIIEGAEDFDSFELTGHTLKLFTNYQMSEIIKMVGGNVNLGFDLLGQDFVANAAEIAWSVRKAR